jgi:gamma-glutamyl:cysteine ligase YbdK (ATP-grasp superfamily)
MVDEATGTRRSTRAALEELLDSLAPIADRLGASRALERARTLVETNGAIAQRLVGQETGAAGVARWLAERFLEPRVG